MTNRAKKVSSEIPLIRVHSCSDSSLFGWLVSSILAKALRHNKTQICHSIEYPSKDQAMLGYMPNKACGLTLSPELLLSLTGLGLSESTLRAHASANYHLADEFINWRQDKRKAIVSRAPTGVNFEGIKFLHYWTRAKESIADIGTFEDFSFTSICAQLDRFKHPIADTRSVLSTLEYGLSVDSNELHSLLREAALTLGVNEEILIDKPTAKMLETKAGVVFDCRPNNNSSQQGNDINRNAVSHCLTLETPKCLQLNSQKPLDLATQYVALDDGYLLSMRVAEHYSHRFFYNRETLEINRTSEQLGSLLGMRSASLESDILTSSDEIGVNDSPYWYSNEQQKQVILLSQSGLFNLMPDGGLGFAAQCIDEWLKRIPRQSNSELLMQHFNRSVKACFESAYGLTMLKIYAANKRDTEFWQQTKELELSEDMLHLIALFTQTGVLPTYEFYPQGLDYYENLLVSLGHCPKQFDPVVQNMSQSVLLTHLEQLRNQLTNTAKALPQHSSPQVLVDNKAVSTH